MPLCWGEGRWEGARFDVAPLLGTATVGDFYGKRSDATHFQNARVCGDRACIAGHRIRVMDIVVWHEFRGHSPDQIVDLFPGINLADVYAALAYYFDHRQEIEDEFRKEDQLAKWVKQTSPPRSRLN